ncbi:CaiB/BaiF CoA transferase family protein [Pseudorhodoferax sp.]|uniref:CaiB/BaiF CoA transferase family protein n=1 Tax=Pseudorhodoferax sp. TaxID=1993553 RepID=UPI002DD63765|nr:CoA transferase [Pseudorhodoferax sp.]
MPDSHPNPTPPGPLEGVRIIDLTSVLLGPYCTVLLGDLGADVVKVEGLDGDSTRNVGPARHPGMSGVFLTANRNKRSIAIDLKQADGRAVLLDLVRGADVFVTNVRRKPLQRLGLAYADLAAVNPGLVYCNAVGYGAGGPNEDDPAFDDIIQAHSGVAALQGYFNGQPQYVATVMADKGAGLMAALALTAAIRHRDRTGQGQQVDVPMFETLVSFNMVEHLYGATFVPPIEGTVYPRPVSRFRRPYRTADGHLAVLPYNDGQWLRFFAMVGRDDFATDPRFATLAERTRHVDALYALIDEVMATRGSAEWLALLHGNDIPAVAVKHPTELLDDPQLRATDFFEQVEHPSEGPVVSMRSPMRMSASPAGLRRHAPRLGQHTREILAELGYAEARCEALIQGGAVRADAGCMQPQPAPPRPVATAEVQR